MPSPLPRVINLQMTELQARLVMLLFSKIEYESQMDIVGIMTTGNEINITYSEMGEANWIDLCNKMNNIHSVVGCSDECTHKED